MSKLNFILLIAGTEVIQQPGISAAGASQEMLRYTAALDAEFIYHGKSITLDKLPVSPSGIVSPALISRACLNLLGANIHIVDLGAHIKPQCPYLSYREEPSACPSTGQAMSLSEVEALYVAGRNFAHQFNQDDDLVVAECVVGGTTTALGLLRALGYECQGMISSSIPQGNHELKNKIIHQGLIASSSRHDNPLAAVAALGDPMQAFAAGLALEANARKQSVSLAGGSQMLAVHALIDKLGEHESIVLEPSPWVVNDNSARFMDLQRRVAPGAKLRVFDLSQKLLLSDLDAEIKKLSFNACEREIGLEEICAQYDQGHVKEGVGMGALLSHVSLLR